MQKLHSVHPVHPVHIGAWPRNGPHVGLSLVSLRKPVLSNTRPTICLHCTSSPTAAEYDILLSFLWWDNCLPLTCWTRCFVPCSLESECICTHVTVHNLRSHQRDFLQLCFVILTVWCCWSVADSNIFRTTLKLRVTTVGDPPRWPRDTPLPTKVDTKFRRQVAVVQSVKFACGLKATELLFNLFTMHYYGFVITDSLFLNAFNCQYFLKC
jgi:hypothetical protein